MLYSVNILKLYSSENHLELNPFYVWYIRGIYFLSGLQTKFLYIFFIHSVYILHIESIYTYTYMCVCVWCFSDRASWINYILITNLMHWLLFIISGVCVYGPTDRTHTRHWFKITLPNTDQPHDKHLWTTTNNFSQVQLHTPWWWIAHDPKHVGVIFNFVSLKLLYNVDFNL